MSNTTLNPVPDLDSESSNRRSSQPKPNPKGNNPLYTNLDASDDIFTSDGDETTWPDPNDKTRLPDAQFLERLTSNYNKRKDLVAVWGNKDINFEGEPPKGYALFRKQDLNIYGHPSGKAYRSIASFIDHLHSILTESLRDCECKLCKAVSKGQGG